MWFLSLNCYWWYLKSDIDKLWIFFIFLCNLVILLSLFKFYEQVILRIMNWNITNNQTHLFLRNSDSRLENSLPMFTNSSSIPFELELPGHFGTGPSYLILHLQPYIKDSIQVLVTHQWWQVPPLLLGSLLQPSEGQCGHSSTGRDRNSAAVSSVVLCGLTPNRIYNYLPSFSIIWHYILDFLLWEIKHSPITGQNYLW